MAKVLESGHPDYKKGDLVWGFTKWEEYSLVSSTRILFKVEHRDVPLSYYTGILGMSGRISNYVFLNVCGVIWNPTLMLFSCDKNGSMYCFIKTLA